MVTTGFSICQSLTGTSLACGSPDHPVYSALYKIARNMAIRFSKMHSLGNDFVLIDAVRQQFSASPEEIARIADRRRGIGCDQLLVAERRPTDSTLRFTVYNSDGSESGQCGNGARCFARFLEREGLSGDNPIRIQTSTTTMELGLLDNGEVRVDMGIPRFDPPSIPFNAEGNDSLHRFETAAGTLDFGVLSMGNPHAVTVVSDVADAAVARVGPEMERHARFPERVNVGFMEIVDRRHIRLRVYERGVGETQACGSGACAAVVSGIRRGLLDSEVTVSLPGGELAVSWGGEQQSVLLTGDAIHVFDGTLEHQQA